MSINTTDYNSAIDQYVQLLRNCTRPRTILTDNYRNFSLLINGLLTSVFVLLGTVSSRYNNYSYYFLILFSVGNVHSAKFVHIANFDKNRGVVLAVSVLALAFWDTLLLWSAFFYYGLKSIVQTNESELLDLVSSCCFNNIRYNFILYIVYNLVSSGSSNCQHCIGMVLIYISCKGG
jgi:hypothetical protein